MRILPILEAAELDPLWKRQQAGYSKPTAADIAPARAAALKSPIYQKIIKLRGVVDDSTPKQVKNGTIHFMINGHIYFQCTSTLAVRYQGPNDHNSRRMTLPAEIASKPLDEAYIVMLEALYERFQDYGREGGLDITEAQGFKPSKERGVKNYVGQPDHHDLSLKYRGITSLKGLEGSFGAIDLDGNLIESLETGGFVKCMQLLVPHNPIKTFKGMPHAKYLNISGVTGIDWHEEAKNLSCDQISGVSPDTDGFGALLYLPSLTNVHMGKHPKLSTAQNGHISKVVDQISRMPKAERRRPLLELQQWAIDNDIDDYVHP